MAPRRSIAEVFHRPESDAFRYLPEGPRWLRHQPALCHHVAWVAIQHGPEAREGSVHLLDVESGVDRSVPLPGRPGFLAETDRPGTLLVGIERGLFLLDLDTGLIDDTGLVVDEDPSTLVNDGVATPFGVVFGTKNPAFTEPVAGIHLHRPGAARLVRLRGEQVCSNGKIAYEDSGGWHLVDIDSPTRRIVRYRVDLEAERLVDEGCIAELGPEEGFPDGMVATPDGKSAIVAIFQPGETEAGEARQINLSTGALEAVWETPGSPQVTCPALIERAGKVELLLTTAAEHMDPARRARHRQAGCLFLAPTSFETPPPPPHPIALTGLSRPE